MKHKVLGALGAMISVIGMSMAAAAPALAKPVLHDKIHESGSEVVQPMDPLFCLGSIDFPVLHEWRAEGMLHFSHHGDGLAYAVNPIRATDTWTNILNGKTLTVTRAGQEKDHQITDNGDGTLTIEVAVSGVQKAYGPDGSRMFLDAGLLRFEILIDHAGTPADPSDDEFIEFLGETVSHGRADTMGRDFCEDLVTFIG